MPQTPSIAPSDYPLRVLLSEGSSTSAREAVTILGRLGHAVEICDPDPHCIGRFSRFVRKYHRCPGLGQDPEGYVAFMLDLVRRERFDVLLPIHEQGLALCKAREQIAQHTAIALPDFSTYMRALSKAAFSRVLAELTIPQPHTRFVRSAAELACIDRFPVVVKAAIGTASRSVWLVKNAAELRDATDTLSKTDGFADDVLVQDFVFAPLEHAQAVFRDGELVAMHAYRQLLRGAGGGDALKDSVDRPDVREHLARIGRHLRWHGALSVDYLDAEQPLYIDCNPRLVEPMNAFIAGNDLLSRLMALGLNRSLAPPPATFSKVRTHIALQVLMGTALRTRSRIAIARECWRLATGGGVYRDSQEELTPVRWDWPSVIPLWFAAAWLLISPGAAEKMLRKGWGAHLLNPDSVRRITSMDVDV